MQAEDNECDKIDLQVRGDKCWDHVGLGGDSTGTANVTRIWGRGVCYDIVCMVFVRNTNGEALVEEVLAVQGVQAAALAYSGD